MRISLVVFSVCLGMTVAAVECGDGTKVERSSGCGCVFDGSESTSGNVEKRFSRGGGCDGLGKLLVMGRKGRDEAWLDREHDTGQPEVNEQHSTTLRRPGV